MKSGETLCVVVCDGFWRCMVIRGGVGWSMVVCDGA